MAENIDACIKKSARKKRIKWICIGAAALLLLLFAAEEAYVRIIDARRPYTFPLETSQEELRQAVDRLPPVGQDISFDFQIPHRALVVVTCETGQTEDLAAAYAPDISSGRDTLYTFDTQPPSAALASRWDYTHHTSLYQRIFHYDLPDFLWYEDAFPTAAEQEGKPRYRYHIFVHLQKRDIRCTLNIFCKSPDDFQETLMESVEQINARTETQ